LGVLERIVKLEVSKKFNTPREFEENSRKPARQFMQIFSKNSFACFDLAAIGCLKIFPSFNKNSNFFEGTFS
jgi:hypothetical protein